MHRRHGPSLCLGDSTAFLVVLQCSLHVRAHMPNPVLVGEYHLSVDYQQHTIALGCSLPQVLLLCSINYIEQNFHLLLIPHFTKPSTRKLIGIKEYNYKHDKFEVV